MRATQELGRYGEDLAVELLSGLGMVILERNWRCELGEIDIVARDGTTLVICEVKTRTNTAYGPAIDGVTPRKAARLRRLAVRWLIDHPEHPGEIRIDVVGILRPTHGQPVVEHLHGVA